ncbi:alpha/beta fold hydrolase [Halovenus sp. WSH3]|uniref:Alpha/beta fold hydrolase n=1 Tax=Halovenus carboxidivorans TaxID=2692199 RepID=A0A6B0T3T1_9EURY|nr:alpha/beta fold hydrolase [Halovenus carboxidivorans]MXR52938.1 alpha/beta fold hydrolase [Halovenus carboxidivorans]
MDRREYLAAVGTVGVGALAGCSGTDSPGETGDSADNETDGSADTQPDQPTDGQPRGSDPAALRRRARAFVELLLDGSFDAAYERVSESFAESVPQQTLRQQWSQTVDPLGSFEGFASTTYRGSRRGLEIVELAGEFADGGLTFQVQFGDEAIGGFRFTPGVWSPPEYVDQSAFSEELLAMQATGDCEISATLTLPEGSGSVPGVVLVHGSGDQGRDQRAGPNRTFKELAWGLATRGIAVLRYDQRTVACEVDRTEATVDDLITDDALTAIERLAARERVDSVFVVGHSLGGRLAPRIAARSERVAGVVMIAPLAEPIHEAIVRQTEYQLDLAENLTETQRERRLSGVEALAERIRTLSIGEDETINLGGGARGRPFFRTLQEYDHLSTAAELSVPRLILQGERDFLVTVEDDLMLWENALAGESTVEIIRYENLNHRLQPGEGMSTPSEWTQPTPVAETVVNDIAGFVTANQSG